MPSSPCLRPSPLSYAQAVKSLSFSAVSLDKKLATCRDLLSSNYHPDPTPAVLQFLCSCFSKDCPAVDDCYTIHHTEIQYTEISLHHQLAQWTLLSQVLSQSAQSPCQGLGHRESPWIPDPVLIQAGLQLLRGPDALKQTVSKALYVIVEKARYTRDIHTNTWLFCAVARAEGQRAFMAPLRSAATSNFVMLLSRESDKDLVAAVAARIASHAVPSDMANDIERTLVYAIRASLSSFRSKFAPWVFCSEVSLPQAIQFLLKAYAKYPLKKQEHCSSEKRPRWNPVQRDANEFFDAISQHIHDALRDERDPLSWDEGIFRSRMEAVSALYVTGSENGIYSSVLDFADSQEKKRRTTSGNCDEFLSNGSKTHGILKMILRAARLANSKAHANGVRLQLIFRAIAAIADFSFVAIDDSLPEIMELFLTQRKEGDSSAQISQKRKFFCDLLSRYERSRAMGKLIPYLTRNSRIAQSLMPILKHAKVQIALASTFGNLRGSEGQGCLQSLVKNPHSSPTDILGLTLISSLLLETTSGPLLQATAHTITSDVVDVLLAHGAAPESRHCRTHLLASLFLAATAHKSLSTENTVRIGILRLASLGSEDDESVPKKRIEAAVIDALTHTEDSLTPAELCSNLRCFTALIHYAFRDQNCSEDHKLISQALRACLSQFRMLRNVNDKKNLPTVQQSPLSKALYDSVSLETVLPWIGSITCVLRQYFCTEVDDEAVEKFLRDSFLFFPAGHPFWRELSEETKCAPKVLKVASLVLNELSDEPNCPKRVSVCLSSRVLKTLSVLPVSFFNHQNHQGLSDGLLAYIKSPCCLGSRRHALRTFLKLQNTPEFRMSLLSLCGRRNNRDVLETNRTVLKRGSKGEEVCPYETATAAMRVLASLVPEQLQLFLKEEATSVLAADIGRIGTDFETEREPSLCSDTVLCDMTEVFLDLRRNLHAIRTMDAGSNTVQMLEKTTECIRVLLPACLTLLSKVSKEKTNLSAATRDTLSAISRSISSEYGEYFFEEISATFRTDIVRVCVPYIFHPQEELQQLAIHVLSKLPVSGEMSSDGLIILFLSLFDRFYGRIQRALVSFLRNDSLRIEAIRKNILVATSLSACCLYSCSTVPIQQSSTFNREKSHPHSDFRSYSDLCLVASVRLLSRIETLVRTLSLAVQHMSGKQLGRFRASGLLHMFDHLVSSLLRSCVHTVKADRLWIREDMEKILLLTKQVVERVCSGKSFLENESTILMLALQICRSAAKRYTALIPIATQTIVLLLRRSLSTEDETALIAVREIVEEICSLTKTWETLSALLADCSTALTRVVDIDTRRVAERTAATLFRAVSEPKAQQVLGSLPDPGKEALTHVWQTYSDRLVYSGN